MSRIELKPCPFCGSKAALFVNPEGGVVVICTKCKASTRSRSDIFGNHTNAVEDVVDDWNARVYDDTDAISKAKTLEMIHELGSCDAAEEWAKGWDEAIDAAYSAVEKMGVSL